MPALPTALTQSAKCSPSPLSSWLKLSSPYSGLVLNLLIIALAALSPYASATAPAEAKRPNVLLVLFDDAGFMDFGAYGSDTRTPNIDQLGAAGVMFSRYYTHPQCGPSRASLLTGQDNHLIGSGSIAEVLTAEMRALPAYSMRWSTEQSTIASRFRAAGYQTFVTGKWGIGDIGANLPHRFGFGRSWVLDSTGASNYQQKSYLPLYKTVSWFEDGEATELPQDFYSSRNIVDKMIDYLEAADRNKPFFSYLAFQAIHIPVQVPETFIKHYDGVFDEGWDVKREQRLRKAIALGLVPDGTPLHAKPHNARDWDSLDNDEKRYWARVMQVNAGMMEAADFHLGRLLTYLREKGQLDNTIVVVTSDNGPEYNTLGKTSPPASLALERLWMKIEGWDVDYDNLGQPGSMAAIGQEWASVSAAPFHLFKFNASEGGLRVPMLITGPGVIGQGFVDARSHVTDLAPTLLDAAHVPFNPSEFSGRSLVPILSAEALEVYEESDAVAFEVSGAAALYKGKWKITKTPEPFGDGAWHLFDIELDPSETTDVAVDHPEVFRELLDDYQAYAAKVGVFELAPGQSARSQLTVNGIKKFSVNYWYLVASVMGVSLIVLYLVFFVLRRIGQRLSVMWGVKK